MKVQKNEIKRRGWTTQRTMHSLSCCPTVFVNSFLMSSLNTAFSNFILTLKACSYRRRVFIEKAMESITAREVLMGSFVAGQLGANSRFQSRLPLTLIKQFCVREIACHSAMSLGHLCQYVILQFHLNVYAKIAQNREII